MKTVILKFGGTSLADPVKIRRAAALVRSRFKGGVTPVAVVSAPADSTDDLLKLAAACGGERRRPRENDALLAAGEQISAALMALALESEGAPAMSFNGGQAGLITDAKHGAAELRRLAPVRLKKAIREGKIPVVAGFQGMTTAGDITTLGRGGSDLTAVALARALKADCCEFLTDVKGVYTAHPGLVPEARKIKAISFAELIRLADLGTEVRQLRAVRYAARYGIPLHLRSSFHSEPGTMVTREGGPAGVTCLSLSRDGNKAFVSLVGRGLGKAEAARALAAAENAGLPAKAEKPEACSLTIRTSTKCAEDLLKLLHAAFL